MNGPAEHEEAGQDTRSGASRRRSGGCGCLGWAAVAVFFLLMGGRVTGGWTPVLLVVFFLVIAGVVLWPLLKTIRVARAHRGTDVPSGEEGHPLADVRDAGPGVAAARDEAHGPGGPQWAPAPAAAPETASFTQEPAAPPQEDSALVPVYLPDAPWAPEAPKAPESPWS